MLQKLSRVRCWVVILDFPNPWRPVFWSFAMYCFVETPQSFWIIFLHICVILWRELMMHNTVLIEENCEQPFCLDSNLASLSTDVRPSLKQRNHSKTRVQLMESSPKAILIMSYASVKVFRRFWLKFMHTRCSVFSIILSVTRTQTLPLCNWDRMKMTKARTRVPSANRSRYARTRSQDAASLGASSYPRNNNSLVTFWPALVCVAFKNINDNNCVTMVKQKCIVSGTVVLCKDKLRLSLSTMRKALMCSCKFGDVFIPF